MPTPATPDAVLTPTDTEEAWVTMALHPPGPNVRFAVFIAEVSDVDPAERFRATVLAVDFVALQHVSSAAGDDDDELETTDSRIVPIVIDWTGTVRVCTHQGGTDGFVALAPDQAAADAKARQAIETLLAGPAATS